MARIAYVHLDEHGALAVARRLLAAGHEVAVRWSAGEELSGETPDLLAVSLERSPGRARAIARWLRGTVYGQPVPLVFVGGGADRAEQARDEFPEAVFCEERELASVVTALTRASR